MKRKTVLLLIFVAAMQVCMAAQRSASFLTEGEESDAAGMPAHDFDLKVLDGSGKTLKLSELRGKAVLLNFWATWSEPSKVEIAFYIDMQKQYGSSGLQVIGVTVDESNQQNVVNFAKRMNVNYPILWDDGRVGDLYDAQKLPTAIFINRLGEIVARESGIVSPDRIRNDIRKALGPEDGQKQP